MKAHTKFLAIKLVPKTSGKPYDIFTLLLSIYTKREKEL